jgi:hypothetical protein
MPIKRVVAMFNVDTGDGTSWDKTDIALFLDAWSVENGVETIQLSDDPDATVWDSVGDFLADLKNGHINEPKEN